jgi:hypothetical protein
MHQINSRVASSIARRRRRIGLQLPDEHFGFDDRVDVEE